MIYWGKVVDNIDPEQRGRVRVFVNGKFEPHTDWLDPVAMGSGTENLGGSVTPKKGDYVMLFFPNGNLSNGKFMPTNEKAYSIDGETIFQFGEYEIAIAEGEAMIIKDGANRIELQAKTGNILMKSPNIIHLEASAIRLEAPYLTLNKRLVVPSKDEI